MIFLWVLLLGCGGAETPDGGGSDAGSDASVQPVCDGGLDAGALARGLSRMCSGGVIASGFTVRNGSGAEPLARLGAFIQPQPPDSECSAVTVLSRAMLVTEVDPRQDEAVTLATYHVLSEPDSTPGVQVVVESVGVDVDTAAGPETRAPVIFNLGLAGLEEAPAIAVVIQGFEIDTDVAQAIGYPADHRPADGYPLRSFGIRLGSLTRDGADLRFEVTTTLAFAASGTAAADRAAAIARARIIVHYAVVGLTSPPVLGQVSHRADCRRGATSALTLAGPVGARAVPGLTAFTFEVEPGSSAGAPVRELSVLVDDFSHDAATGRADMNVLGYLEGPDDAPLEFQFDADIALLGWTGAESVESLRYASTVTSGRAETSLPLSQE